MSGVPKSSKNWVKLAGAALAGLALLMLLAPAGAGSDVGVQDAGTAVAALAALVIASAATFALRSRLAAVKAGPGWLKALAVWVILVMISYLLVARAFDRAGFLGLSPVARPGTACVTRVDRDRERFRADGHEIWVRVEPFGLEGRVADRAARPNMRETGVCVPASVEQGRLGQWRVRLAPPPSGNQGEVR